MVVIACFLYCVSTHSKQDEVKKELWKYRPRSTQSYEIPVHADSEGMQSFEAQDVFCL